jgi:BRCA1-associated protein
VALRAGELPVKRSDLVCLLAVPGHYTYDDICRFMRAHLRHALQVRVLRDQRPDRLVVAIKFASQQSSDDFFRETNGARFNEVEPERCKVAFLSSVEFVEPTRAGAAELFQSVNQHEMPTCPVCLERLEESVSGILITLCNHSFHCSCLSQWKGSETSCPVCRYTLRMTPDAHASRCDECDTTDALWICLICGHVGCSRYRRGHASDHFRQTGHIYSLELDSQRVWDYGGDGYVHRLIQNKTDGKVGHSFVYCFFCLIDIRKVVELPSPMQSTDFREPEKIHKIVTEYNFLLLSQLEAQRSYYEELLQKARSEQGSSDEAKRLQKTNAQQTQQISQLKVSQGRPSRGLACGSARKRMPWERSR